MVTTLLSHLIKLYVLSHRKYLDTCDMIINAYETFHEIETGLRPVSVEFHREFHCIKCADMAKRGNVGVSRYVRRVSSPRYLFSV
jgi:hypothetical protein